MIDHELWEYKHRPTTIDGCVLPTRYKKYFNAIIKNKKLPNLLLSSQRGGTGKTTVAWAITNELDCDVMFVNASAENGISLVRNDIPSFCRTVSLLGKQKVVILDESDNLTADAQKALRGCIDEYSSSVRFILTCNFVQNLSEPLKTRFDKYVFEYSDEEKIECIKQSAKLCLSILKQEGVKVESPKVVVELVKQHSPDNRSVVIALQKYSSHNGIIDEGVLAEVSSVADVSAIVDAIKNKQFKVIREVSGQYSENADTIIVELYNKILPRITPQSIPDLVEAIGLSNRAMSTVVSKEIEMTLLLTQIMCTVNWK